MSSIIQLKVDLKGTHEAVVMDDQFRQVLLQYLCFSSFFNKNMCHNNLSVGTIRSSLIPRLLCPHESLGTRLTKVMHFLQQETNCVFKVGN